MALETYFDVLGVDSEATLGEIKKRYRKLVFKYHPDYNPGETARKKYSRVLKAYKVLSDPVKKDEYSNARSNLATDEPWQVLNRYWEFIFKKGMQ